VILLGNLGKDPEIKTLDNGQKVASFSLATSETYKDKNTGERVNKSEWHNVSFWGGIADVCEKYLKKGSQIYLEGKIQTRSYEKDGDVKYVTNIIGNTLQMLGSSKTEFNSNEDEKDDLPF